MSDTQDAIIYHNFNQQLPKAISNKVLATLESLKQKDEKGGKFLGKSGNDNDATKNKDIITDSDKNHSHWKL